MGYQIKTSKSWKKHLPQKPRRVERNYYTKDSTKQRKKIIKVIKIILCLLLLQSIFQIGYLKIDKINLVGNKDVSLEEIQSFLTPKLNSNRLLIFKNNNYFLLRTKELEDCLLKEYNLDDVQIKKKFPDQLNITVVEKISYFIWQKDDSLYLLDAKGALNREILSLDNKYIVLQDIRAVKPEGIQIFNSNEIELINQVYLSWNEIINSNLRLNRIVVDDDWDVLELYTDQEFLVRIDPRQDIKEQLDNLNRIVTAGDINIVDIDYIDIRFGDRVYFK